MYKALELAKYIVSKCIKDNAPLNNLKLQAILYYIQKEFLDAGDIAFFDDIEAWKFGPVVPNVYYRFCTYGAMPIDLKYDTSICNCDIDRIIEFRRESTIWELLQEIRKPGGAWDVSYKMSMKKHKIIPISLMVDSNTVK